ncbi:MAG: hypothetical protein JSS63_05165 [Bacteroidetes bacterium]|nr:hypothetical protein [Bacteroidota bacterium]
MKISKKNQSNIIVTFAILNIDYLTLIIFENVTLTDFSSISKCFEILLSHLNTVCYNSFSTHISK